MKKTEGNSDLLLKIPKKINSTSDKFMLVQLPDSLSPTTLLNEKDNLCIVGSNTKKSQACLITETQSFALNRLETSNTLVLVVPDGGSNCSIYDKDSLLQQEKQANNNCIDDDDEPMKKKLKPATKNANNESDSGNVNNGKNIPLLSSRRCHLLGGGVESCYFLELKEKHVNLDELQSMLPILDPYNNMNTSIKFGISLTDLAEKLQLSTKQICCGIQLIPNAIEISPSKYYFLLSEEVQQSVQQAILAALIECDVDVHITTTNETEDYYYKIQDSDSFVQEILKRMNDDGEPLYPQAEDVIRSTLFKMVITTIEEPKDNDKQLFIDFQKVAILVAHNLFRRKIIWIEEELYQEWQAKIPGTTTDPTMTTQLLLKKGVAVAIEGNKKWKYLPIEKLSKTPKERFLQLFDCKEQWTKDELEYYLPPLPLVVGKNNDKTKMLDDFLMKFTSKYESATTAYYFRKDEE